MTQIFSSTLVTLTCVLGAVLNAQLPKDAAIAKAETILKNLQDNKTGEITKEFNAALTQALPESRLKAAWPGLVAQFGAFKSVKERREGPLEGRQAVELILNFEKETVVQRIVFDTDGKLGGLVFRPLSGAVLPAPQ